MYRIIYLVYSVCSARKCFLCTPPLCCRHFCSGTAPELAAGRRGRAGWTTHWKPGAAHPSEVFLDHSKKVPKCPLKEFPGFFNTTARPGAAWGRRGAGLGCPQGAVGESGTQPLAGGWGLEAEKALGDILFSCLWLQGGKQGQRNTQVWPQKLVTFSGFALSSFCR